MKKILCLIVFFLCFSSAGYAETLIPYHNTQYKFSLDIPKEFKSAAFDTPFVLDAYTNEKIFLLLKHITTQKKYGGTTFGELSDNEIESFIKQQRLISALNTAKFNFFGYDRHITSTGFPYIWAMFISDTKINDYHFRTYMLRNYFLRNNIIIEIDFIIPEEDLPGSIDIINKMIASYKFDSIIQ
ncbi:MAG: hypothetical protein PHH31_02550 [Acidaminococcaceae bacterium]|nr:hypothetical protein [Acidaminococcaceae bacterium]